MVKWWCDDDDNEDDDDADGGNDHEHDKKKNQSCVECAKAQECLGNVKTSLAVDTWEGSSEN